MSYSPAPAVKERSKPSPWNVHPAFVSPEHQELWRDLKVVLPFWDRTHGRHDGAWETGAVTSDPQLVARPWGQALDFDETDDHVEWASGDVGDAWAVAGDEPFTVVCVIHTDTDLSGSNFEYFLSLGGFEAAGSFNFYITESATSPWRLALAMGNPSEINDDAVLLEDTSFVVAARRLPNGTVQLFADGVALPETRDYSGQTISSTFDVNVGRRSDGDANRYFGGSVYSIYKWNRALSEDELYLLASDPFGPIRPNWGYVTGAAFDPANLSASVLGSDVTLTWDASF